MKSKSRLPFPPPSNDNGIAEAVLSYRTDPETKVVLSPAILDKLFWVPSKFPWDPYSRAFTDQGPVIGEFFGTLGDSTCGDKRGPYGNNDYKGTDARTYKAQKFQGGLIPFPALTPAAAKLQERHELLLHAIEQTFVNTEVVGEQGMELYGFGRESKNGTGYLTWWHYMFRAAKAGAVVAKKGLDQIKAELEAGTADVPDDKGTLASLPDPNGHYKKLPLLIRRTRLATARIWTAAQRLVNPAKYREELPAGTPVMMSGQLMARAIKRDGEPTKFYFAIIVHAMRALDETSLIGPEYLTVADTAPVIGNKHPNADLPTDGKDGEGEDPSPVTGKGKGKGPKRTKNGKGKEKEDMEVDA
ncbi:hypothetical protein SISSUDRAFT_1065221 [Sistotremastrum suecicum HHB10207 ss-3]|uniref:Uncharacterized protein n=1 Tax=Sistotremastrum suecicum HHB10207 ss-3 TaxID=1314776 RepID=A0A165ZQF5_9AGAM|nr:hypothetical protein SISSUDRAFT_1065221 [Sistotremastrum suecicum HHB10207 ss-3]